MHRRTVAIQAGVLFVLATLAWFSFTALPLSQELAEAEGGRETFLLISQHPTQFRAHELINAFSAVLGLVGLLRLAELVRAERTTRLVTAATMTAWTGTVSYLLVCVGAMTVTVNQANEVAAGGQTPPDIFGLAQLGYFLSLVAFPLIALAAVQAGVLGRISGSAIVVLGCAGLVLSLAMVGPVFVFLLCALPMGVMLLIRAARNRIPASAVPQSP